MMEVTTKILVVSLIVSEPDTETEYLYVTPTTLNFGFTLSGILPPTKRTELNASANWLATTNQPWVKLVTTSGTSGVGNLDIGLQNVSSLSTGNALCYSICCCWKYCKNNKHKSFCLSVCTTIVRG